MTAFKDLELGHFDRIYDILGRSPSMDTAYSKVNTLGWQSFLSPLVYLDNDFAILALQMGNRISYLSPLATSKNSYTQAIRVIEAQNAKQIQLVSDSWQAEILQKRGYEIIPLRSMSEYLYETEGLALLRGKKYHSKRNFVNGFTYPHQIREYRDCDFDEVMQLMDAWNLVSSLNQQQNVAPDASWSYINTELKISDFDMERQVVERVLQNRKAFNIIADVLIIDNKIEGFCAGEILPNNTAAIYFQKANTQYKGIYAFIDNSFVKTHFAGVKYVNKQEDMGIEGLRKSKLSYHPIRLIDRYYAKKEKL